MKKKTVLLESLLVLALLLFALISYFVLDAIAEPGAYVRVSVDGETVGEYSLSESGEYSINDGTNVLVIEGGYAYMKDAHCPDGVCIRTGKINRTGERIVCLPNRVLIAVYGAGDEILEVK